MNRVQILHNWINIFAGRNEWHSKIVQRSVLK